MVRFCYQFIAWKTHSFYTFFFFVKFGILIFKLYFYGNFFYFIKKKITKLLNHTCVNFLYRIVSALIYKKCAKLNFEYYITLYRFNKPSKKKGGNARRPLHRNNMYNWCTWYIYVIPAARRRRSHRSLRTKIAHRVQIQPSWRRTIRDTVIQLFFTPIPVSIYIANTQHTHTQTYILRIIVTRDSRLFRNRIEVLTFTSRGPLSTTPPPRRRRIRSSSTSRSAENNPSAYRFIVIVTRNCFPTHRLLRGSRIRVYVYNDVEPISVINSGRSLRYVVVAAALGLQAHTYTRYTYNINIIISSCIYMLIVYVHSFIDYKSRPPRQGIMVSIYCNNSV